jgi:hypothetical protein
MVNICDAHYCFLLQHPYSLIVDDDMIVATLIVFIMTTISDIDGAVVVAVSLSLNCIYVTYSEYFLVKIQMNKVDFSIR